MTMVDVLIGIYCVFQAVGCFFVGRACFRLYKSAKKPHQQVIRKASNE